MVTSFLLKTEDSPLNDFLARQTISIVVEDADGFNEDSVCIEIVDSPVLPLPKIGTKIEVSLGVDSDMVRVGTYFVRNIQINQERIVINASALKKISKIPKEKLYKKEKLVDLLGSVADDEGLGFRIDEDLKGLEITEYQNDSNINFLSRIGKNVGCMTKVCDGKFVLTRRENGKTTDGQDLPTITVKNILDWNYREQEEATYSGVRTYYWDEKNKKPIYHLEGEEGNVLEIRYNLVSKIASINKAKAKYKEIKKGAKHLDVTCFATSDFNTARIVCGAPIETTAIRSSLPKLWLVKKVTHQLTKDGLIAHVESEIL